MKSIETINLMVSRGEGSIKTGKTNLVSETHHSDNTLFSKLLTSIKSMENHEQNGLHSVDITQCLADLKALIEELVEYIEEIPKELFRDGEADQEEILQLLGYPAPNPENNLIKEFEYQNEKLNDELTLHNQLNAMINVIEALLINSDKGIRAISPLITFMEQEKSGFTTLQEQQIGNQQADISNRQLQQLSQLIKQIESFTKQGTMLKNNILVDFNFKGIEEELQKFSYELDSLMQKLLGSSTKAKELISKTSHEMVQHHSGKNYLTVIYDSHINEPDKNYSNLELKAAKNVSTIKTIELQDETENISSRLGEFKFSESPNMPKQVIQEVAENQGEIKSSSNFNDIEMRFIGQPVNSKISEIDLKQQSINTPRVRMVHLIEDLSNLFRGPIKISSYENTTQLRVNIHPEQFGHLDIRIIQSDGKIQAQILTSNLIAKEALEQQIGQLRLSLNQQGIDVDQIEISYSDQQQTFNQQQNQENRFNYQKKQSSNLKGVIGYQQITDEVGLEARRPHYMGKATVDYTI